MSSAISIHFDDETPGENDKPSKWRLFCESNGIRHSPQTVGGNVYYYRDMVEITYDPHRIQFSTYFMGKAMPDVARIALAAWGLFGGMLRADFELRSIIIDSQESNT